MTDRNDMRALIESLGKPVDSRITRSGYGDLSTFLQKRAAKR